MNATGDHENSGQPSSLPHSISDLPLSMQTRVLEASVRQLHRQLTNRVLLNSDGRIEDYHGLIEKLLAVGGIDFPLKYQTLNVQELILQNSQTRDALERLVTALGILHKYAINLLKPHRPARWRDICLLNPTFSQKVDTVKGTRAILQTLGYEIVGYDKMTFPAGMDPDREMVSQVTSDMLLVRADLDAFLRHTHPHQQQFALFLQQQPPCSSRGSSGCRGDDVENHLPLSNSLPTSTPVVTTTYMSGRTTMSPSMSTPGVTMSPMSTPMSWPGTMSPPVSTPSVTMSPMSTLVSKPGVIMSPMSTPMSWPGTMSTPVFTPSVTLSQMSTPMSWHGTMSTPVSTCQCGQVMRELLQTKAQLHRLNLEMCALIRCNPDFMLDTRIDSLKRNAFAMEVRKDLLERRKAELENISDKFMSTSNRTDVSAGLQRMARSGDSVSTSETFVPMGPPSHGSLLSNLSADIQTSSMSMICSPAGIAASSVNTNQMCPETVDCRCNGIVCRDEVSPKNRDDRGYLSSGNYSITGKNVEALNSTSSEQVISRWNDTLNSASSEKAISRRNDTLNAESSEQAISQRNDTLNSGSSEQAISRRNDTLNSSSSEQAISRRNDTLNSASSEQAISRRNDTLNSGSSEQAISRRNDTFNSSSSEQAIGRRNDTLNSASSEQAIGRRNGTLNSGSSEQAISRRNDTLNSASGEKTIGQQFATFNSVSSEKTIGQQNDTSAKVVTAAVDAATGTATYSYVTNSPTAVGCDMITSGDGATPCSTSRSSMTQAGCLVSYLADIQRQQTEEEEKQRALRNARVDVDEYEDTLHNDISGEVNIEHKVKSIKDSLSTLGVSDELSCQHVRDILVSCNGDVGLAISQCREAVATKLDLLQAAGVFDESEALTALRQSRGKLEEAETYLVDSIIQQTKWSDSEFQRILADKTLDRKRRIRLLLSSGDLRCVKKADTYLQILDMDDLEGNVTPADILESVTSCSDLSRSINYLQQECQLCLHYFVASQIHSLCLCQCKMCAGCLHQYLDIYVREKVIKEIVCPVCGEPDTGNIDLAEKHFEFLNMKIRTLMSPELYSLFEHKVTEWHLMRDPNFRWCSQRDCVFGFIGDPTELRMECPTCRRATCFKCKKPWADQHEGVTCEEFQAWIQANDPEHQQAGLARHLEDNGIDCPHCNFRYSLAKGGCMHFKCIQCGHEFCSGCLRPFKRGSNCNVLSSCQSAGLHCHHPRDCLFYLRDRDVSVLQKLLRDHRVDYNTAASGDVDRNATCQVMEQKETPNGLQDEPCQRPVPPHYARLCETHYKEYLVSLINKKAIDPVVIMSSSELERLITNAGKPTPPKARHASTEQYYNTLVKRVKQLLPLPIRR